MGRVRNVLSRLPRDAKWAYVASAAFALWVGLQIVFGPGMAFLLFIPCGLLILAFPVLTLMLLVGSMRDDWKPRIIPLSLASICTFIALGTMWGTLCTDLHVMLQIYRAGGPHRLNAWAQEVLERQPQDECTYEPIPEDMRAGLGPEARIGTSVGIEFGGGFYHYGLIVHPTNEKPQPEWWHAYLDWPQEISIYHED